VRPQALKELSDLPGNVRNRVKSAIDGLGLNPRPPESARLRVTQAAAGDAASAEARRLRLDHWRVIYLVSDAETWVTVIAVRRRPPYDYQDLALLTASS
jgi:mRNA-degrading endonuclease RelE of RelBE toxin-antitoxin system